MFFVSFYCVSNPVTALKLSIFYLILCVIIKVSYLQIWVNHCNAFNMHIMHFLLLLSLTLNNTFYGIKNCTLVDRTWFLVYWFLGISFTCSTHEPYYYFITFLHVKCYKMFNTRKTRKKLLILHFYF
jgi:hypothetical protein